jgi:acyl-coenzyme A synthetase/AMP-(fatty) acid ligase
MLQPHEHMHDGRPAAREVLMSCGRVAPQVSVRIVDEVGRELPPGTPGEVLVKSPTQSRWDVGSAGRETDDLLDGYLRIGDTGVLSVTGYLTLLGRQPDILRRHGRVIHPRYAEEALHDHPAIKEASYVQGPNGMVMAFSLRRTWRTSRPLGYWSTELARHLTSRVLHWQMPNHYHEFDELPRSPLGKVLRREVRGHLAALAALAAPGAQTLAATTPFATAVAKTCCASHGAVISHPTQRSPCHVDAR